MVQGQQSNNYWTAALTNAKPNENILDCVFLIFQLHMSSLQTQLLFQRFHSQMFAQVVLPSVTFLLLCWSHSGRRSRSAHRCGLSIVFMRAKSSVSRTYKNCHMLPTRSWLLFYFFNLSDGDKMGSSKWNRLRLHIGQSVTLITSFSFGNITTHTWEVYQRFFSEISLHPHKDLFSLFALLDKISARYVYFWVRCF